MTDQDFKPEDVLNLWFPDDGHWTSIEDHAAFWETRMQGGMDARIISDFADLTQAAAEGRLDHWAKSARGRLALLIALDQFPRSLWRDTPAAYAQDIKATRLALEGIANGHFDQLKPWEQSFFVIAIGHCEGPDHLERWDAIWPVADGIANRIPAPIDVMADRFREQHDIVREVLVQFGRHPHRNEVLGRPSTPAEREYVEQGVFPHNRDMEEFVEGAGDAG